MPGPLVGRDDEVGRVLHALVGAHADGAVIGGPPGIGKSRLLSHCLEELERRGWHTVRLSATEESAQLPLAVFAPHLPASTTSDPTTQMYETFHALHQQSEGPFVLAVDDVNWLDPASVTVLQLLVDGGHVRVLMTVRTEEDAPDTIERLCSAGRLERVELAALSRQDVEGLLEALLEGPAATATKAELWRLTQGSPLLLHETVRSARDDGALFEREGVWLNRRRLANTVRLTGRSHHAIDGLDAEQRHALELIAVAEPVEISLMEELVGRVILADLEERGLVVATRDGQRVAVETTQPLQRHHLLELIPVARRRAVSQALANALHDTGLRRLKDQARWVTWQLQAGATVAPEHVLKATQRARQTADQELALALAPAAHKLDGFDAQLAAGEAYAIAGRYDQAAAALADAGRLALNEHDRALVAMARAQHLMLGEHRPQEAIELLRHESAACTDPHMRDRLAALEATFLSFTGELKEALDVSDQVVKRANADPRAVLSVLTVSAFIRSMLGRPADALDDVARGAALVPRLRTELPLAETQLGISQAYAALALGRVHDSERMAAEAYHRELDRDAPHLAGSWATTYASILLERGKVEAADHILSQAALLLETDDPLGLLPACLGLRAYAAALAGDAQRGRRELKLLDVQFGKHHRFMIWRGRALVWLSAVEGDHRRAQDHAATTADWAENHQQRLWATWAYHDLVRLGAPERAVEALDRAARRLDTPAVAVLAEHARALSQDAPQDLYKVAQTFAKAGNTLYAAEAAGQAAAAHRRAGSANSAARAASLMQTLLRDCPGAATSGLAAPPPELTDRELEVARLAARGNTSKQIAEQLGITVRTADNHLHRTYRKLGITNRRQLRGTV